MPNKESVARKNKKLAGIPLALRLLEVCEAIPALKFTEHNPEYDFDWVKASQIYEEFRRELLKRKILIFTDESEISHQQFNDGKGEPYRETTIRVGYEVRDCLSDAKLTTSQYGVGVAPIQTGFSVYIAKTMANKYFLRGIAMIPWAEGDQEFQNRKRQGLPDVEQPKKMSKVEKAEDAKIRAWHSAVRQGCKNEKQVLFYLVNQHNCETVRDLFSETRKEELSQAMAWALRTMPNEDDVKLAKAHKQNVTPIKGPQPAVTSAEAERIDEIPGAD